MTWALLGRWLLARLPQLVMLAGAGLLLAVVGEWWAGVRSAPLAAEIVRLQAVIERHEGAAALAAETAALAVQASQVQADAKHREDAHEINRLLDREAGMLAADAAGRRDLARRLREQWAAGRAAGRADRAGLPEASGARREPAAAAAAAGLVHEQDPAADRFDVAADVALTGEATAALARILYQAALNGRCIKLRAPDEH